MTDPSGEHAEDPPFPRQKGPYLFLLDASSNLERNQLLQWIERATPTSADEQIETAGVPAARRPGGKAKIDPRLEARLGGDDDPLLVPLRVVWMPKERDGERRVALRDVVWFGDPRDPGRLRQRYILRRYPDRCRIVVGAPARASELIERWQEPSGRGPADATPLAEFVALQAWLALERSERALRGNRYKVPKFLREDLYWSRDFQQGVAALATHSGKPLKRMQQRTAKYLKEIAATHSPYMIDIVTGFTGWLISRAHRELHYDVEELRAIYDLGQRFPLVFLPSHKSNFDHLVLQYVLYANELPPNHTAGGINLNFFPVGPMLRRSGIFFIRREFKDNEPYKFTLRRYIDYLIENRFPLEWYIEGGRSRSGKMRAPRLGLLSYVVDSYQRGLSDDVVLVPVSIAYDQISDVSSYASEQRGGKKEREGLAWALRFVGSLNRRYGAIHLRFGRPVSVAERLPPELDLRSDEGRLMVPKLAFEVSTRINDATPITPISLVTLALLGRMGRGLTVEQTLAVLEPFLDYVKRRDLPTTVPLALDTPERVQSALDDLAVNGVVARHPGPTEIVYVIGPDQHLAAAYYRNTIIHFFVNRSIAELAVASGKRSGSGQEEVIEIAFAIRDVLKFEFFFGEREEFVAAIRSELDLQCPDWGSRLEEGDPEAVLRAFAPYTSVAVLRPFLEAYMVVADVLVEAEATDTLEREDVETTALELGRQYLVQGKIVNAEAISTALFDSALQLAGNRGLLQASEDVLERRIAFAAELRELLSLIEEMAVSDRISEMTISAPREVSS